MARATARGKHAAPDGIGNVGSYGITSGWQPSGAAGDELADADSGLDELPYVPEVSTFDIETGANVATPVPPDETRFGRAWRDPEPDVPVLLPRQFDDDGSGHVVPGEGRSRSSRRPVVAFVALLVALAGIVAFVGYGAELWGGRRIPNLVGASEGNARGVLGEKGFVVEVVTQPVDDGIGFVLATDPAAGERLEAGETVTVTVGAARVVPEVAGLTEQEARQALIDAGAIEVRVVYQAWDATEGTVVAVDPAVGASFTSRDTVTLTIAQAFTVPDVVGLARTEALAAVGEAGLVATVVEVPAAGAALDTVTETDPAAGTKLEAGAEVVVKVAVGTPAAFEHLSEYFAATPAAIDAYVSAQGFALKSAWTNDAGEAQARYQHDANGTLTFTSRPFSRAFDTGRGDASTNVLAGGTAFVGVRWDVPADQLPEGADQLTDAAMAALVERCGLTGQSDACDQDSVVVPAGTSKLGTRFRCVYGEVGGLAWSVLVTSAAPTRAAVTCAPRSLYDTYDLDSYGGRPCCLIAYADLYGK